jgi:phage terminase large subunit-like protein
MDSLAYQPPMVSMQETFGHDLHPWQADIVATLFYLHCVKITSFHFPLFFVFV